MTLGGTSKSTADPSLSRWRNWGTGVCSYLLNISSLLLSLHLHLFGHKSAILLLRKTLIARFSYFPLPSFLPPTAKEFLKNVNQNKSLLLKTLWWIIFSPYRFPVVLAPLVEDFPFPAELRWHVCWKFIDHINVVYFQSFSSVPLSSLFILMPISHCLEYHSFIGSLEARWCLSSNFVLSQNCFGYSRSFHFQINSRRLISLYQKAVEIGDSNKSMYQLGTEWIH